MGHRKIETVLIYTQLLQFDKDDNYTCKIAQDLQQATELIENGFEYVTEMDGLKSSKKENEPRPLLSSIDHRKSYTPIPRNRK
jgi:hypothetical protein